MLKVLGLVWEALRLSKIIKSRTTTDQYLGNGILLIVAGGIGAAIIAFTGADPDTVINGLVTALVVLSPLVSRVTAKLHQEFDVKPDELLIRVRKGNTVVWTSFSGCLRDAQEEKWETGVLADGMIIDVAKGRKLGRVIRMPKGKV
jgi:hypothetical protein